jgi:UPF0755 protein
MIQSRFLRTLIFFCTLFLLLILGFYFYTKHYLSETIQTPTLLFIPAGSTKNTILTMKEKGLDLHWFDYYLMKMHGLPQAGWIDIGKESMSREELFEQITHAKAALQKVTLIPGETNVIFLKELAKNLKLDETKLLKAYQNRAPYGDGVIFAETYQVPRGIKEDDLILYLLENSLKKHEKLSRKLLGHYDEKEWFTQVVTKASIIQKEASDSTDMPFVSAVIENRLKKKMKLQMDGTLNYGAYSHVKVTAKRIKEDSSSFNTYKHTGLPPTPLCATSEDAIKAGLNPAKVNYLYFVKGKAGKHIYTRSYKQHLKNIPK